MEIFSKLKTKKILLIDDDQWIRDSMSLFFEAEGCHIYTLETSEEGIELLNRQSFDIFIVDYRLPGMDGLSFFRRIQKSFPKALKILITAYGNDKLVDDANNVGVHDFINKPLTAITIIGSLSRHINFLVQEN